MIVLGFEASGLVASVAIVEDNKLLGEYTINHKRTHSKTLMPMLDELKNRIEIDLDKIDAIAVASGPGSYTGLRISSSTAKGLGMALNKPIVSIPTMDGLAYNLWGLKDYICPIMDARRNQVYTGVYNFDRDKMHIVKPQSVLDVNDLLSYLCEMLDESDKVAILGDGVNLHHDLIIEKLGDRAIFAPGHVNMNKASSIAMLGIEYLKEGKTEEPNLHRPRYLKLSQAERERLDSGKGILEPSDG